MATTEMLDRLGEIEKAVQQSVKIFDFAKTYEMLGAEELAYDCMFSRKKKK